VKKSVKDLVIYVLRSGRNGMTIAHIYQAIMKLMKGVKYVNVEAVIRGDICKKNPTFIRIKRGEYELVGKKNVIPVKLASINGQSKAKDNVSNKKEEDELRVEEHLGYLNSQAKRLGKEFFQDPEDMFSELISIAYDYKHLYNVNKGKPTTFLLNNVVRRLRNKITREIVPNIFKLETVIGKNGEKEKKATRKFLSVVSLSSKQPNDNNVNVELIDTLDSADFVADREDSRPDYFFENIDFNDKIRDAFLAAGAREKDVILITKRYGLETGEEMTLDEVGEEEKMTKEGVRQAIKRVFKALRSKHDFAELKRLIA